MSQLFVLFALIAILTTHFVLPSNLLMSSALILAFALTNFLQQTRTADGTAVNWTYRRIQRAVWWAVFLMLSFRLLMLISEYF